MDVTADDERLLIEAAQADPARFLDLYDRYVDRVYAYVSRRAGSRALAEDVTSDVFERALTHLPRFEWRGAPFTAWLFRIAANALAGGCVLLPCMLAGFGYPEGREGTLV